VFDPWAADSPIVAVVPVFQDPLGFLLIDFHPEGIFPSEIDIRYCFQKRRPFL